MGDLGEWDVGLCALALWKGAGGGEGLGVTLSSWMSAQGERKDAVLVPPILEGDGMVGSL